MLLFLLFALGAAGQEMSASAPDGLDRDITVVGRDDAELQIPLPWTQRDVPLPEIDLRPLVFPAPPPFLPPAGDWSAPWYDPRLPDPLLGFEP